jgi:hypothetical protein
MVCLILMTQRSIPVTKASNLFSHLQQKLNETVGCHKMAFLFFFHALDMFIL